MPRDGAKIYHRPFPDVVPDTTIESTVYNGFVADVEYDLNAARPIAAGGTGASSATEALVNLGGGHSGVLVTNYDSHVWLPGSFYSAAGASGAPVAGHAFVGISYSSDPAAYPPANQNLIVEARDQNDTTVPGRVYIREKKAGVWGAWVEQVGGFADTDARYVNAAGDTMTGPLTLTGVNIINYTGTNAGFQYGSSFGATRFFAGGYNDTWTLFHNALGTRLSLDGPTGVLNFPAGATVPTATLGVGNTSVANTTYVESRAQAWGDYYGSLRVAKTGDNMTGTLTVNTEVYVGYANAAYGVLRFGSNGANYIEFTGSVFSYTHNISVPGLSTGGTLSGGYLYSSGNIYAAGTVTAAQLTSTGNASVAGTLSCGGLSTGGNLTIGGAYYSGPNGLIINGYHDIGGSTYVVDFCRGDPAAGAEMKHQLIHHGGLWAGHRLTTNAAIFDFRGDGGIYVNGFLVYYGLLASSVQEAEAATPEMAQKARDYIDGKPTDEMSATSVIYALINAVKELKARVEQLEAMA